MTRKLMFIDLFGGIGGFRHGLEQASDKYECVGYYDKDKYAVQSYNRIFNENHDSVDVNELDTEQIPDHDVLCAGFPCQSFSIAGKREGFEDTRGTLFFEIARIAGAKKPEVLLLENVKGLHSHDNGETFRVILETLDELGYYVEWQILNSKHWGVPQNRERVFIIGHLGGEPRRKVFPIRRENRENSTEDEREIKNVGNVNPSGRGMNGKVYKVDEEAAVPTISTNKGEGNKIVQQNQREKEVSEEEIGLLRDKGSFRTKEIANCLDANYWKGMDNRGAKTQIINHQMRPEDRPSIKEEGQSGGSGILYNSDYSYALSNSPHFIKEAQPVHTPAFAEKGMNMKSRIGSKDGSMFTVDGTSQHGVTNGVRIRKLTPKETWRLQGFPDSSFEAAQEVNSDTQLYKQAGNAVTVNVIKALGEEILDVYFGEN